MASILGITMVRVSPDGPSVDLAADHQIDDFSFTTQPFTLDPHDVFFRCATGVGPSGGSKNTILGGWYFNKRQLSIPPSEACPGPVVEQRGASGRRYPGIVNLYLCGIFTTTEEGVYECHMRNSSGTQQIMRVGVYLSGRSESLDMYPITSLLTIFYLSTQLLQ